MKNIKTSRKILLFVMIGQVILIATGICFACIGETVKALLFIIPNTLLIPINIFSYIRFGKMINTEEATKSNTGHRPTTDKN